MTKTKNSTHPGGENSNDISIMSGTNILNPYDFVGEYHNNVLDYIFNNAAILKSDSTLLHLNIIKLASDYVFKNATIINKNFTIANDKLTGSLSKETSVNYIKDLYNYEKDVIDLLGKYGKLGIANTINSIVKIEQKVIADTSLNKSGKIQFLCGTSILRYSLAYFSIAHPNIGYPKPATKEPPRWVYTDMYTAWVTFWWEGPGSIVTAGVASAIDVAVDYVR